MIEAKDLRMGDIVRLDDETYRVTGVVKNYNGSYSCYVEYDDYCGNEILEPKYLDPIPLAPSVLKKNGWNQARHIVDRDAEWYCYEKQGCATVVHYYPKSGISSVFFCGVEIGDCMFVHQFQHLLWVLDEDTEMEV